MADTTELTRKVTALRNETQPDSITPETLGNVLQAIVDFIAALGLIDISEETDLAQRVVAAENAANAASSAAAAAQAAAAKNVIDSMSNTPDAETLKIGVKQHGHSEYTTTLPAATETSAGVMSATDKQHLDSAHANVSAFKPKSLTIARTATAISLTLRLTDSTGIMVSLPSATTTYAGLLSKSDKVKLDGLPEAATIALVDDSGHLNADQGPVMMLDSMDGSAIDEPGTGKTWFDIDMKHICYWTDAGSNYVDLGSPSQNLVYCDKKTNVQYRWNGSAFEPINGNPLAGLTSRTVRCSSPSAKRYDIPAGVLCILKPTTDTANFNLLSGGDGKADVHRIVIESSDLGPLVDGTNTGLKWPSGLVWNTSTGTGPSVQDVDNGEAILVTIYNQRYAEFTAYR